MIDLLSDSDQRMAESDGLKMNSKGFKEYREVGQIKGRSLSLVPPFLKALSCYDR